MLLLLDMASECFCKGNEWHDKIYKSKETTHKFSYSLKFKGHVNTLKWLKFYSYLGSYLL